MIYAREWLYVIKLRLRILFRRKEVEREIDEELQYHIDQQIQENLENGLTLEQARREAFLRFGGIELQKEECRDTWEIRLYDQIIQDILYSAKKLWQSLLFTAITILSLAFSIGINIAIFQLVSAIKLQSLPIQDPASLVQVDIAEGQWPEGVNYWGDGLISNPLWERIREQQTSISGMFAWRQDEIKISQGAQSKYVDMLWVSGSFFTTLGIQPELGRLFNENDDRRDRESTDVVISYKYWQSYFNRDNSIIGKSIFIGGKWFTILGVTPSEFYGLEIGKAFDIILPFSTRAKWDNTLDREDDWSLIVMGRLKPDWSMENATHQLNSINPNLFEQSISKRISSYPSLKEQYSKLRLITKPAGKGLSRLRERYEKSIWSLFILSGLILAIACITIANLMLVRLKRREQESAIRIVLGSSRLRLFNQLFIEALILTLISMISAIGIAQLLTRVVISFLSIQGPIQLKTSIDWMVLLFSFLILISMTIIYSISSSVLISKIQLSVLFKSISKYYKSKKIPTLQSAFLLLQIVITHALIANSFLYIQNYKKLITQIPEFFKKDLAFAKYSPSLASEGDNTIKQFEPVFLEQILSINGVKSAASTSARLFGDLEWTLKINMPGEKVEGEVTSQFLLVSSRYFETTGIPIIQGSDFTALGSSTSSRTMIVNEAFIEKYIPGKNPIDANVLLKSSPVSAEMSYRIIGVAKNAKYRSLNEDIPPICYVSTQETNSESSTTIMFRYSSHSSNLSKITEQITQKADDIFPGISVSIGTVENDFNKKITKDKLVTLIAQFYTIIAIIISIVELYSITMFITQAHKKGIGIRLTLGASKRDIIFLVLKELVGVVIISLIVSVITSLLTTELFMRSFLDISRQQALLSIFVSVGLLLGSICFACLLPIYRSSRLNPIVVLKEE